MLAMLARLRLIAGIRTYSTYLPGLAVDPYLAGGSTGLLCVSFLLVFFFLLVLF